MIKNKNKIGKILTCFKNILFIALIMISFLSVVGMLQAYSNGDPIWKVYRSFLISFILCFQPTCFLIYLIFKDLFSDISFKKT